MIHFQVHAIGINSYSWTATPSGTSAGLPGTAVTPLVTNNNITVSPIVPTNYQVTVTSSNGCINTSNVAVTVNNLPTAGTISGGNAVCMGNTLALTSNASGTGTLTYT